METTNIGDDTILNCPICLNPIIYDENGNGVNISKTSCDHSFHTSCLLRVENCKCPICRTCMHNHEPIIDEDNEDNEDDNEDNEDNNNIRTITNLLNNLMNSNIVDRSNLRNLLILRNDSNEITPSRTNEMIIEIMNERDLLLRERNELMNEAQDVVNEIHEVLNNDNDTIQNQDDDDEEEEDDELVVIQREQELVDRDHEEYIIHVLIDYDDGTQDIFNISKFKFIYNDSLNCIHRFCDNNYDDKCCRCIDVERTSHCKGCRSIDITFADEYGDEKVIEFIKYYIKVNEGVMKYIVL